MYCPKCGKELVERAHFCPNCGYNAQLSTSDKQFSDGKDGPARNNYKRTAIQLGISYLLIAIIGFWAGVSISIKDATIFMTSVYLLGSCAAFLIWKAGKNIQTCSEQEKNRLKTHAIIGGVIILIAFLLSLMME